MQVLTLRISAYALTIFDQLFNISTSGGRKTLGIWLAPGFEPRTSPMKTGALPLWATQKTKVSWYFDT